MSLLSFVYLFKKPNWTFSSKCSNSIIFARSWSFLYLMRKLSISITFYAKFLIGSLPCLPLGGRMNYTGCLKIIIIIIILSCHQHGYPWPSLATPPYCSSLLAGPLAYIPYLHRAAVCRFEPVSLPLLGRVRGSIGEHHLWAHPCFSSCVLHVWFV